MLGTLIKELHDKNSGNTARIFEYYGLPYKNASQKVQAYILLLTADYDNNVPYMLTTYETIDVAIENLNNYGIWKE